jgi:hypothetical protein
MAWRKCPRPAFTSITSQELDGLLEIDTDVKGFIDHYHIAQSRLHGECFYLGLIEPKAIIGQRIRDTEHHIRHAKALADR